MCQTDCNGVFSWTRTSTHLLLSPIQTVLPRCRGRSGQLCSLRTLPEAPGSVPADQCQPTRIRISFHGHLRWSYSHKRSSLTSAGCRGDAVIYHCRFGPRCRESTPGTSSSPAARLMFVWVGYLMTPYNPSHKYPYIVCRTMLYFEALQRITPRRKVGNLSARNLCSVNFAGARRRRRTSAKHYISIQLEALCDREWIPY